MGYVIVGDTAEHDECLVYTCGKSLELAMKHLNQIQTNPTANDKHMIRGMKNLRVQSTDGKHEWWNDQFLAN